MLLLLSLLLLLLFLDVELLLCSCWCCCFRCGGCCGVVAFVVVAVCWLLLSLLLLLLWLVVYNKSYRCCWRRRLSFCVSLYVDDVAYLIVSCVAVGHVLFLLRISKKQNNNEQQIETKNAKTTTIYHVQTL